MKYNRSKIMKLAWEYIQEGLAKSEALKLSWQEAKQEISYWQWKPYLDHKRDIISFAYNIEKQEIENELYLWFCKIIEKYDSTKSCLHTYMENQFRGFITSIKRQNKKKDKYFHPLENQEEIEDSQQERFNDIVNFYYEVNERLTKKAQKVLQFIFDCEFSPREVKDPTRKISREAVIRYFYNIEGWKKVEVKEAWSEIGQWWKEFKNAA